VSFLNGDKMENKYMQIAYKEALKAKNINEVPVGAVIIKNDKIIAKAYNKREKTNKITDHAEIIAINKAAKKLKTWKLIGCDIYITLEPCNMCLNAILQARINNIYCAAKQIKKINTTKKIIYIKEEDKYKKLLTDFFKEMRK